MYTTKRPQPPPIPSPQAQPQALLPRTLRDYTSKIAAMFEKVVVVYERMDGWMDEWMDGWMDG
ncbi:hypothetical protein V1477_010656 [Vespula maculifrons]|uniref:Uncharacterized protein n=1 Tax=Vespula maculifrons TaxID=7453 RepID=A0ABD2C2K4_VESMC